MGDQRSLRQILEASRRTVEEASDRLQLFPARSERRQCKLPQTFTEATQYVQAKEDEKRKREAKKDKQKQRGSAAAPEIVPGLIPGPPDSSPFWLVTEVWIGACTHLLIKLPCLASSAYNCINYDCHRAIFGMSPRRTLPKCCLPLPILLRTPSSSSRLWAGLTVSATRTSLWCDHLLGIHAIVQGRPISSPCSRTVCPNLKHRQLQRCAQMHAGHHH